MRRKLVKMKLCVEIEKEVVVDIEDDIHDPDGAEATEIAMERITSEWIEELTDEYYASTFVWDNAEIVEDREL